MVYNSSIRQQDYWDFRSKIYGFILKTSYLVCFKAVVTKVRSYQREALHRYQLASAIVKKSDWLVLNVMDRNSSNHLKSLKTHLNFFFFICRGLASLNLSTGSWPDGHEKYIPWKHSTRSARLQTSDDILHMKVHNVCFIQNQAVNDHLKPKLVLMPSDQHMGTFCLLHIGDI